MRARELGIAIGELEPAALNAITDVEGVRVGHTTLVEGPAVRTGVTMVVPPDEPLFAGTHRLNGNGEARHQLAQAADWVSDLPASESNSSPMHPYEAQLARMRAAVAHDGGDLQSAQEALDGGIEAMAKANLAGHPYATEIRIDLADLEWQRGERDESRRHLSDVAAVIHQQFVPGAPAIRRFQVLQRLASAR